MTASWPTAHPRLASWKWTPVSVAWVGTDDAWRQVAPSSSDRRTWPRSPTATIRPGTATASSSSDCDARGLPRANSTGSSGSWAAIGSPARSESIASATIDGQRVAGGAPPRSEGELEGNVWAGDWRMLDNSPGLAHACPAERRRRVVLEGPLDGEVEHRVLVVDADRQIAASLQIRVDL